MKLKLYSLGHAGVEGTLFASCVVSSWLRLPSSALTTAWSQYS